ncbi:MAG: cyanophycin synthetase [Gemmatimonadales bacterium]
MPTPDALERALQSLRPGRRGKLIVVFGRWGGPGKARPVMGKIAAELADLAIVIGQPAAGRP